MAKGALNPQRLRYTILVNVEVVDKEEGDDEV
jgi:hypothetical protein